VPQRNRVDPYGEIVAIALRGRWMGNRGCIHRDHAIVRGWNTRRWITCALAFKGWVAPKWAPGRWTALFFYDEAVALSAGHRPCALCRRADYERYLSAAGFAGADALDAQLHAERLEGRRKRRHAIAWRELRDGTFVEQDAVPHLVLGDRLLPWFSASGYGAPIARPTSGATMMLTPPTSLRALENGYAVQVARPS